ncbi:MAG TPA: aspartyl protease family protein [Pyrinomonadaceae bacterium]|nr:aspartyl protease family protein [Pyrinomonadaceae bacterium]
MTNISRKNLFARTVALLLLLAAPAVSCAQGQPSNLTFLDGRESFTVPFEMVDNRIFVGVWLEGKGPFKFVLDTGGNAALSVETAKKIGAKLGNEIRGSGAGESVVTAWETSVAETRIGGLALKGQGYNVFDFSDMRHVFGAQTFDGVIGLPIFSQTVVRVDYARKLLTFTKPSSFRYGGAGASVPLELNGFIPVVRGEVDGVGARFGLDTGDRSALTLKSPFVAEYKLREKYAPEVEAVTGFGIGGPVRAQVTRVGALKFGGGEVREPVTRLSLQKSGAFAAGDVAGNIGGAILKQFTLTFDYGRRLLYLEKSSSYGRRDTYDRAGLWLSRSADGRFFEVFDVVANGPAAEAGLKAGDRVVAFDGKSVETLQLIAAREELKDAARKSVRLTVQDGERTRDVVVTLRDLV